MHPFEYRKVLTLGEAFDAVADSKGDSVLLAGGTDLLVKVKNGALKPRRVIDMKGIPELGGIAATENGLSIGALTRIRTIETAPEVLRMAPLLSQAASKLGSVQVRNKATLGGNLCNAAPSAETAPALLALDARAEIYYGREGKRIVDLREFFSGPGLSVLREGEILTSIQIPLSGRSRQGSVYYKLSNRKAMDIAFVGVAVLLEIDPENRIGKARIALGAVAPTPIRVVAAEERLQGRVLDEEALRESAELAGNGCRPISDLRASSAYRKEMVKRLCRRGLSVAYGQAVTLKEAQTS
jgi:aerobic carbon-monoxide dehydrogenase medium subunit